VTPLSSTLNPIDLTPGMMTNSKHRANLPEVMRVLADAPALDYWLFLSAGFANIAPELVEIYDQARKASAKPLCLTWQAPPAGIVEDLAARGIYTFDEHARAVRAIGHIVRYARDLGHAIHKRTSPSNGFAWNAFVPTATGNGIVVPEHVVARILEAAKLPVAAGRIVATADEAVRAAHDVGFPVAMKAISPTITHRAAAGLVALNVATPDAVAATDGALRARAKELGASLEGIWVQHMFAGDRELLITALRDREFGVMVGCGIGGGMTEVIDDVAFARAPLDSAGALDLLKRLDTLNRLPHFVSERQLASSADFVARFSALVATAPWPQFTFEINPLKLGNDAAAAVDGLLLIE
jgi:acyl-CoA synthetase (NDP forming)